MSDIEQLVSAYRAAKHAVLHGVEGTTPETVGGVSKDEALEYAADFIEAIEARGGAEWIRR